MNYKAEKNALGRKEKLMYLGRPKNPSIQQVPRLRHTRSSSLETIGIVVHQHVIYSGRPPNPIHQLQSYTVKQNVWT